MTKTKKTVTMSFAILLASILLILSKVFLPSDVNAEGFDSFIGFIYKGELFYLLFRSGMDVAVMFIAVWIWEMSGREILQ